MAVGIIPSVNPLKTQGISVADFREEFGSFTFSAEYDDTKYSKLFSNTKVEKILDVATRTNREALEAAASRMQ
jgi:hypothetical protein